MSSKIVFLSFIVVQGPGRLLLMTFNLFIYVNALLKCFYDSPKAALQVIDCGYILCGYYSAQLATMPFVRTSEIRSGIFLGTFIWYSIFDSF
jgi:hypothetical protein